VNADHREIIDRRINSGRREVMTIAAMATERVVTGEKRTPLGGTTPSYATEWKEPGRLKITLIDDVVTAVEGTER